VNTAASPAVLLAAARRSQRGLCRQGHGRRDSTLADKRLPQLFHVSIYGAYTGRWFAGPFPDVGVDRAAVATGDRGTGVPAAAAAASGPQGWPGGSHGRRGARGAPPLPR